MGKIKDDYLKYLEETYNDIGIQKLIKAHAEADQLLWEEWRAKNEMETDFIMVRDFIHKFVDPLDIPKFWNIMLEEDPGAMISSFYPQVYLMDIIVRITPKKQ